MIQKTEAESESVVRQAKAINAESHPEGGMDINGADTSVPIAEGPTPLISFITKVVSKSNMALAYRGVVSNKGAAGVDGMKVEQLEGYLKIHWSGIREKLETGTYHPQPVRKVEIPKPGGGKRMLGIPTAIDRLITQAILQQNPKSLRRSG